MSPSIWQILIVVAIVLLLFGPSRIPGLGKSLGQAIRGFKKGINEDEEIDVTDSAQREQVESPKEDLSTQAKKTQEDKEKNS